MPNEFFNQYLLMKKEKAVSKNMIGTQRTKNFILMKFKAEKFGHFWQKKECKILLG